VYHHTWTLQSLLNIKIVSFWLSKQSLLFKNSDICLIFRKHSLPSAQASLGTVELFALVPTLSLPCSYPSSGEARRNKTTKPSIHVYGA
jgi:hypothetical protein